MTTITFIGLGNMGLPMAENLLKNGQIVHAFDLVEAPLTAIKKLGAKVYTSVLEAVNNADVVISMLPAGQHVSSLYLGGDSNTGLLQTISPKTLVIDCSTIDSETAIKVHLDAESRGIPFVDAPVSGGVAAANAGTLTFMCGGNKEHVIKAKSVLQYMGANIFHAGDKGAGQVAKMCNNMLLAIHMIGTSEALKLGEKNGLDAKTLSEIMLASSGKNWSLEKYNPYPDVMSTSPASNNYKPGFMVDLMAKDLNLATSNSKTINSPTPLGDKALELYLRKQQAGDGKLDFSSIIQLFD